MIDVAEVWAVGARSDKEVCDEMNSRVASLPDQPTTIALADAVAPIGRLAAGITPASPPVIDPVPGWLADRLVHTVGMNPAEVASLSLEQAVDAWTEWTSAPR